MEDAQQRKARLKALREAAATTDEPMPEAAAPAGPELKFRNYAVRDRKIEHTVLEPAQPPKYEPPKPEAEVGKKPEAGRAELCTQDLLASIAPKKPNWDLRRDVEKKLARLERRTQRALVELVQQQQQQQQEAQEAQ